MTTPVLDTLLARLAPTPEAEAALDDALAASLAGLPLHEYLRAVHVDHMFLKQRAFVDSTAPFAAAITGVGGGKTRAGAVWGGDYAGEHKGSLGMITAPTYPMLRDATLRTVLEILPTGSYELLQGEMRMVLRDSGSEILFRSTDDPDKLRGPNLAWVWMDEAAQSSKEAFQILQGRLRQPGFPHLLRVTSTPRGYNWLYDEFAAQKRADYELHHWSARDNPHLTPEFIRHLQESYADDFALQEIDGQFVLVGGLAFFAEAALRELLSYCTEPRETRKGGLVSIWKPRTVGGRYVAGGDLAWGESGKGARSVLTVVDFETGEQVAEICGRPSLDEMADEAVKLCREYNDAFAMIERNGEGKYVCDKMAAIGYAERMYHDHAGKPTAAPGVLTAADNRPVMLADLEEAVRTLRIRPRCKEAVQEMMTFVRDDTGRPAKDEGKRDDHVMSWAHTWQARKIAWFGVNAKAYEPAPAMW